MTITGRTLARALRVAQTCRLVGVRTDVWVGRRPQASDGMV